MRQFLIFIIGVLSMFVAMTGFICAIQAIATMQVFHIICAVVFAVVWVYMVLDYFKNKVFEDVANVIYNKIKK